MKSLSYISDNEAMEVMEKAGCIYDWLQKNSEKKEKDNNICCLNVFTEKYECPFRQNENSPLCMMRLYDIEPGQTLARQYCLLATMVLIVKQKDILRALREQPVSDKPTELTRDIIISIWKKFFKNVRLGHKEKIVMKNFQKKYRQLVSLLYGTGVYLE